MLKKIFVILFFFQLPIYANQYFDSNFIMDFGYKISNGTGIPINLLNNYFIRDHFFLQVGSALDSFYTTEQDTNNDISDYGIMIKANVYHKIRDNMLVYHAGSSLAIDPWRHGTISYSYFAGIELIETRGIGIGLRVGQKNYTNYRYKGLDHFYISPYLIYTFLK